MLKKSRIGIMKVSTPFTIWKMIPKTCKNFFPQKNVAKITGVFSNGVLIGFVALFRDDLSMEIGLGLRPDLTGKGLGSTFLDEIEQFILDYFPTVSKLRLSVASFNIRAQKVYQCAGFLPCKQEMITTNGGEYPFLIMEKYLFNT